MQADDPPLKHLQGLHRVDPAAHPVPGVGAGPNPRIAALHGLEHHLGVPVLRGPRVIVQGDVNAVLLGELVEQVESVRRRLGHDRLQAHVLGELEDAAGLLLVGGQAHHAVVQRGQPGGLEPLLDLRPKLRRAVVVELDVLLLRTQRLPGEQLDGGQPQGLGFVDGLGQGELVEGVGLGAQAPHGGSLAHGQLLDADLAVLDRRLAVVRVLQADVTLQRASGQGRNQPGIRVDHRHAVAEHLVIPADALDLELVPHLRPLIRPRSHRHVAVKRARAVRQVAILVGDLDLAAGHPGIALLGRMYEYPGVAARTDLPLHSQDEVAVGLVAPQPFTAAARLADQHAILDLEAFRLADHRPLGQVLAVEQAGEALIAGLLQLSGQEADRLGHQPTVGRITESVRPVAGLQEHDRALAVGVRPTQHLHAAGCLGAQQRGDPRLHRNRIVSLVQQIEVAHEAGDRVLGIRDLDRDLLVMLVGRSGLAALGSEQVLGPHGLLPDRPVLVGRDGVVQDQHRLARGEQRLQLGCGRPGRCGLPEIVPDEHVELGGLLRGKESHRLGLANLGPGDVRLTVEHLEELAVVEPVAAGDDQGLNRVHPVRICGLHIGGGQGQAGRQDHHGGDE